MLFDPGVALDGFLNELGVAIFEPFLQRIGILVDVFLTSEIVNNHVIGLNNRDLSGLLIAQNKTQVGRFRFFFLMVPNYIEPLLHDSRFLAARTLLLI